MISKTAMDEIIYRYGWLRSRFPRLIRKPLGYFFYITGSCNLDCHYCWQRDEVHSPGGLQNSSVNVMEPGEWVKIVRNLPRWAFLGLSGGEVTMSPALGPIVVAARGRNPVTVNTNALSVKDEQIEVITDAAVRNISISLDGFAAEHDASRNRPGLFNKVVENVNRLNEARKNGKPSLTIKSVLSNENMEYLAEFRTFCEETLKADALNISFQKTGDHSQFSFLKHSEIGELFRQSRPELMGYRDNETVVEALGGLLDGNGRSRCKAVIYPRMKTRGQIREFLANGGKGVLKACYLPFSMVVVLPDGEVIPCLSFGLGNAKEFDYNVSEVLKNKRYKQFCDRLLSFGPDLPEACNVCCFSTVNEKVDKR